MIWTIAAFELRKRARMLSSYVYFAVFFACGALSMLAAGGAFSGVSVGAGSEKIHANAPLLVSAFIATTTNFGVLVSAAVFGQAVHQDYEKDAGLILFALPLKKSSYLAGRFLGALAFSVLVFASIGLGQWLVSLLPVLVNREFFGPTPLRAYLWPYLTIVLPNLVCTGGLFFALATLTRRMMPVYVGAVLVAVGYLAASSLLRDLDNERLAALVDPLGMVASGLLTRYWTVAEKNSLLVPFRDLLPVNRLLWAGLGIAALVVTYLRFEFRVENQRGGRARSQPDEAPSPTKSPTRPAPLAPEPRAGTAFVLLARLALRETFKNVYFAIFALAGGLFTIVVTSQAGRLFGTATYPVTGQLAQTVESSFAIFMLIIIVFYAGEIAWRERDLRFDTIADALPVPTWVFYLAKLTTLCLVPAVLLVAVLLFGVAYQTVYGYRHYEIGLYLQYLYGVALPPYVFLCVLAIAVQSVVANKYLGHFVLIGLMLFRAFQSKLGMAHRLFKYGEVPDVVYSDMNGFGHFLKPLAWYDLYWTGFAICLAVVGHLFWVRGTEAGWRTRAALARARLRGRPLVWLIAGLGVAAGAGGFIYYNSDVVHRYRTPHQEEQWTADEEKAFKRFEKVPQPRVTDVRVDLDVYPAEERLHAHGVYELENKNEVPVNVIYLSAADGQRFHTLRIGDLAAPTASDAPHGWYSFTLPQPMAPHARLPLEFDMTLADRGFKEAGNRTDLAENGTFVNSFSFVRIGYGNDGELTEDNDRKKFGLAPRDRLPPPDDPLGLGRNLITRDADWVTFEATVSTSPDQIAVAPGYLQKEWTEGGRRFFHYKMDSKMLDFFAVLSARYEVMRDKWNGVDLEIYYHKGHEYDLAEMMEGMKAALAYDSENFGPYQHRQARILEFPRYSTFAQSFPNTIPYSESIGFIARVDPTKDDDVDYPLYVTAHEISHQWWAHQVIGGNVQGVTLLDETLAQYSALMVMKKRFGPRQIRRFLKYELDQYLRGRSFEQKKEVALARVENQPYIHYNKGSLVMYALQDFIGEAKVNQALVAFLNAYKFKGPPYPNSTALVDELKKVTPPDMQYLIVDMFETITLYDNRALHATTARLPGGKYKITLTLSTKKMRAAEDGRETEIPMDDYVDVGALDERGQSILTERRKLKSGETVVEIVVDKLPAKAGVDPLDMLIDRHPDDNVIAVPAP